MKQAICGSCGTKKCRFMPTRTVGAGKAKPISIQDNTPKRRRPKKESTVSTESTISGLPPPPKQGKHKTISGLTPPPKQGKRGTDSGEGPGPMAKGEGIRDVLKVAGNFIDTLINGKRRGLPPKVRDTINKYKDSIVSGITVQRKPVQKVLVGFVNALSKGRMTANMKRLNYDNVYHLSMVVKLDNGVMIRVEKNEVIRMAEVTALEGDVLPINMKNVKVSFGDLIGKTAEALGGDYWEYSLTSTNCQHFVLSHLKRFGLSSPATVKFISQDALTLIDKDEKLAGILKKVTDLGGLADTVLQGRGISQDISKFVLDIIDKLTKPKTKKN